MLRISSLQNELIKNIIRLNKAGERKKQNLFIIEGYRELNLCRQAGYEIDTILFCNKFLKEKPVIDYINRKSKIVNLKSYEVSDNVFSKIAYRDTFDGVIALAKPKDNRLSDLKLSNNPLIIVLETIEKPGNLGAILRTADAANVDAVIICDSQTDIYNPNTVRASLGTLFTNQIACCSNEQALEWLKKNNIKTYATSLKGVKFHYDCDFKERAAILMGSEAFGLTDFWHNNSDELIKIPMNGKVDSLNVSVSMAIVIYEVVRQRKI